MALIKKYGAGYQLFANVLISAAPDGGNRAPGHSDLSVVCG